MKTTIKMMLSVMIVLVASAQLLAYDSSLKVNEEKTFDLVLYDVLKTTQITLKDANNNVLYKEDVLTGTDFMKTFNMELLLNGKYFVNIEDETKTKMMTIELSDDRLEADFTNEVEVFKPVISIREGIIYLTQFSPNESPLYLAIYNDDDEMVHEETLKGRKDLGKIFDFSSAEHGTYHFYLSSNGYSFHHYITIN